MRPVSHHAERASSAFTKCGDIFIEIWKCTDIPIIGLFSVAAEPFKQ